MNFSFFHFFILNWIFRRVSYWRLDSCCPACSLDTHIDIFCVCHMSYGEYVIWHKWQIIHILQITYDMTRRGFKEPNPIPVLVTGTGIFFSTFLFRLIRNQNFDFLFRLWHNRNRKVDFLPEFNGMYFSKIQVHA